MSLAPTDKAGVRPLEVKDMGELARHYDVPAPLMNLYFCIFKNRIYTMERFLIPDGSAKRRSKILPSVKVRIVRL